MAGKWMKGSFRGVEYRQHESRKHGVKFDRYFRVRFMVDGKAKTAGLGWATEGWTEEKAALKLKEYRENEKTGGGPSSLREEQKAIRERQEQERLAAKADAETARLEQERIARENITVTQYWLERYFPERVRNKPPKTVKGEEQLFRNWIQPAIGHIPLNNVEQSDIERLKDSMLNAPPLVRSKDPSVSTEGRKEGRSPRTCQYALAVTRQMFNHASRKKVLQGESPMAHVELPRVSNQRKRFLSCEQSQVILERLKERSVQLHDISLLSLRCGLRAGEIFNLQWADIDFDRDQILIRDPKGGFDRHAYLTPEVKEMLNRQGRMGGNGSELVFKNRYGGKIKEISNAFNKVVDSLGWNDGIEDSRNKLCFHSLRHSFASQLVEAGVHLQVVRELMGHKTLQMTQRYAHVGVNLARKAVQNLDAAISKAQSTLQERKVIPFPSVMNDS